MASRATPPSRTAGSGGRARAVKRALISTESSPYYRIWVLTNVTGKPFGQQFGERFDLNLTEWRVLLTVADQPGITAQALSDLTGLDKMSVSRMVRKLESQGRLVRDNSEADRRSFHLSLTDEGWAVYGEIAQAAIQREAHVYAGLSSKELDTLHKLLGKLLMQARNDPTSDDPIG
jgi:DNA-binding MarR family transcriptional regulator